MSFDWLHFLTVAERLHSAPDIFGVDDACLRTATSRAYFAAFHHAMSWTVSKGYPRTCRGTDHTDVEIYFRDSIPSDKMKQKIALELGRLRNRRNQADYDCNVPQTTNQVALAILDAQSIIKNVNSLSNH